MTRIFYPVDSTVRFSDSFNVAIEEEIKSKHTACFQITRYIGDSTVYNEEFRVSLPAVILRVPEDDFYSDRGPEEIVKGYIVIADEPFTVEVYRDCTYHIDPDQIGGSSIFIDSTPPE